MWEKLNFALWGNDFAFCGGSGLRGLPVCRSVDAAILLLKARRCGSLRSTSAIAGAGELIGPPVHRAVRFWVGKVKAAI